MVDDSDHWYIWCHDLDSWWTLAVLPTLPCVIRANVNIVKKTKNALAQYENNCVPVDPIKMTLGDF
jgi:hypothetical protein